MTPLEVLESIAREEAKAMPRQQLEMEAFHWMLSRMLQVAEQDGTRAVFLQPDGSPEPRTRAWGVRLNAMGGSNSMARVAYTLQGLPFLTHYQKGDFRELDSAWCGIGKWRS